LLYRHRISSYNSFGSWESFMRFEVPKEIEALVDQLSAHIAQKRKEEAERESERKRRAEQAAKENQEKGLAHARIIFAWTDNFGETEAGRKLLGVGNIYGNCAGVCFYNGHVRGSRNRYLGVSGGGVWFHGFGCGARTQYADTPEELANFVDAAVLADACEWIDSGRVWECVKKTLLKQF